MIVRRVVKARQDQANGVKPEHPLSTARTAPLEPLAMSEKGTPTDTTAGSTLQSPLPKKKKRNWYETLKCW